MTNTHSFHSVILQHLILKLRQAPWFPYRNVTVTFEIPCRTDVYVASMCLRVFDTQPLQRSSAEHLESLRVFRAVRSCLAQTGQQTLRTPRPKTREVRTHSRWQRPAGLETYHKSVLHRMCGCQVCSRSQHGCKKLPMSSQMSSAASLGRF